EHPRRPAPARSSPVTIARPSSTATALRPPPRLQPPVPGTYSYDTTMAGAGQIQSLIVAPDPVGSGRQVLTQEVDGQRQQQRVSWTSAGKAIVESDLIDGSRCPWIPALSNI